MLGQPLRLPVLGDRGVAPTKRLRHRLYQPQYLFRIRRAFLDDLHVTHHAVFVHDDNGAFAGASLVSPEAVTFHHVAFGMKVGQQGKGDAPELIGERAV